MDAKDPRLVFHEQDPPNSETPLELLHAGPTPLPLFFTRNNFPVPPPLDPGGWRLTIDGLVDEKIEIGLAELEKLPRHRLFSVLECTGNSRSRFASQGGEAEGVPWGEGAIAGAEWAGVRVAELFAKAGVQKTALQAECRGAGLVRGVEVAKLWQDALLAVEMNGAPLPHLHGGPARLVVPGWGGINWVKWIEKMTLIDHESTSSYNQNSYVLWDRSGKSFGKATEMPIKSLLTRPLTGARLAAGTIAIGGLAWSPGIELVQVEISCDGGATWEEARFEGENRGPYAWREFRLDKNLASGHYQLACRATDRRGISQPAEVPWNSKGYLMNAWHRVAIEVT